MYKTKNNFFYFFLFFNAYFVHVYAMENEIIQLPKEVKKIIFCYIDISSKQDLALTCRPFFVAAQEVAQEFANSEKCSFNDFIDRLYMVPNNYKIFKTLCNNCQDEHKNILTTYFFYKSEVLQYVWLDTVKSYILKEVKKEIIEVCYENQQFNNLFKHLVKSNKQDVKYYSDYYNALCCVKLLNRGLDNKSKEIFWFDGKSLDELMKCYKNIQQDITDIRNFCNKYNFSGLINDDFEKKLIDDALKSKKISVLVWLSEWLRQKYGTEEGPNKLETIFTDAETHELRKLLAKSDYSRNLKKLLSYEIGQCNYDKFKSYLEIMIEQGICPDKWYINIKDVFKFKPYEADDILHKLFDAGFSIAVEDVKQITKLTADELTRFVKIGYKQRGEELWNYGGSIYLCRAVQLKNIKLVDYLLSINAPNRPPTVRYKELYVIDSNEWDCLYPICYSLDDDEASNTIFKILIDRDPEPFCQDEKLDFFFNHIYCSRYSSIWSSNGKVEKIKQLFEKGYFKDINIEWLSAAVKGNDDPALLNFLLCKLKETNNIKVLYPYKKAELLKIARNNNNRKIIEVLWQAFVHNKYDLLACLPRCFDVLSLDVLEGDLKKYVNEMTLEQVELLLHDLDMRYSSFKEMYGNGINNYRGAQLEEQKKRIICSLNILLPNGINVFDQGIKSFLPMSQLPMSQLLMFIELGDEKNTIEYIKCMTNGELLKIVLNEAVKHNKIMIVRYLLDSKKNALKNVACCNSENKEMDDLLKECHKQHMKRLDDIGNAVRVIGTSERLNESTKEDVVALFIDSIKFLANELRENQKDEFLIRQIRNINIVGINNIYTRCSSDQSIIQALEVLTEINPLLKQVKEEKAVEIELNKVVDNQEISLDRCDKYLEETSNINNDATMGQTLVKIEAQEENFVPVQQKVGDISKTSSEESSDDVCLDNDQNENKSFTSFDIIKNVFASIMSAFYSIVCFFNPLRFIW